MTKRPDRCAQWLRTTLGTLDLLPALRALPLEKLPSLGAALDEAYARRSAMGSFGPSRARRGSAQGGTASPGSGAGLPPAPRVQRDEQRLFLFAQRGLEEQAALRRLRAGLKRSALPAPPEAGALWAAYASQLGPLPPWQTLAAAETDLYYQLPLLRRGAAYARHGKGKGDCWLYRFDAPSPHSRASWVRATVWKCPTCSAR